MKKAYFTSQKIGITVLLLLSYVVPKMYQDAHRLQAHHHFAHAKHNSIIHFTSDRSCELAAFVFQLVTLADFQPKTDQYDLPIVDEVKPLVLTFSSWISDGLYRRGPPMHLSLDKSAKKMIFTVKSCIAERLKTVFL